MSTPTLHLDADTADDTLGRVTDAMTATTKARLRLQSAEKNLKRIKDAEFCCTASQNQALGAAKKEVKRWSDWLADAETLREDEPAQRSFLDAEDDAEGDDSGPFEDLDNGDAEWSRDEQRSMDRHAAEQDGT